MLDVTVTGLKSNAGVVQLVLCPAGAPFPDCGPRATRKAQLPIQNGSAHIRLADIPAGHYAIAVFHDANSNGKLDTMMGIPKEGYGFSGNPPFRPRAPRFAEADIAVSGETHTTIRLRYLF